MGSGVLDRWRAHLVADLMRGVALLVINLPPLCVGLPGLQHLLQHLGTDQAGSDQLGREEVEMEEVEMEEVEVEKVEVEEALPEAHRLLACLSARDRQHAGHHHADLRHTNCICQFKN